MGVGEVGHTLFAGPVGRFRLGVAPGTHLLLRELAELPAALIRGRYSMTAEVGPAAW